MNEDEIFSKLPKDKLEIFKAALEGYRQGVIDTGKMVDEANAFLADLKKKGLVTE